MMKYQDRVRVVSGFFEGNKGTLIDTRDSFVYNVFEYLVILDSTTDKVWIIETNLEKETPSEE